MILIKTSPKVSVTMGGATGRGAEFPAGPPRTRRSDFCRKTSHHEALRKHRLLNANASNVNDGWTVLDKRKKTQKLNIAKVTTYPSFCTSKVHYMCDKRMSLLRLFFPARGGTSCAFHLASLSFCEFMLLSLSVAASRSLQIRSRQGAWLPCPVIVVLCLSLHLSVWVLQD